QDLNDLDMLGRFRALRGREFAPQLGFQCDPVGLHKRVKPDPAAAIRESDDRRIAYIRVLSDQVNQQRSIVDQSPAAAFAIGEIEQPASDSPINLFASLEPDSGEQGFMRQYL